MAVPPATDKTFLREVDEELRRDRLASAWRRWGIAAVGAAVLVLALFAGWLWWQHRAERNAGVEGERLVAAYDQITANQNAQADTALTALAGSRSDGYRALAMLGQADLLLKKKDAKGAVARFAAIAADPSLAQPFRDLALLRQTVIEFDTLQPQVVVERLRPLAAPASPWFGSAAELTAVAYLRQRRPDLAGKLFGQIAQGEGVPATLRQRAVQMASQMGVDAAPNPGVTPTS